jgi:integrase
MIYSVEKRRKRKAGKVVESRSYYLRYRIEPMPVSKWVSLATGDLVVANSKAKAVFQQRERELAGLALPAKQVEARGMLTEKLIAEYVGEMTSQRRDERYVKGIKAQLERLAGEARWRTLGDIGAESFLAWRRGNSTLTAKTLNEYRGAALKFLDWMVDQDRLAANPLAKVGKIDGRGDKKVERRAYLLEELGRLFAVSGERALLYKTAFYTGLRKSELRELQWGDLREEGGNAFLQLRASTTKNGKADLLPLFAKLAAELRENRPGTFKPTEKVFPALPRMPRFYKDLKAAGIPRVDAAGRVSDFHALRKTFATLLMVSGCLPRVTQSLMRHSDLKLTTGVYTDQNLLPLREAVEALPWLGEGQECAQIGAQISVRNGRFVSQADAKEASGKSPKPALNKRLSRALSHCDAGGQMVRAAGFEPATPSV